MGTIILFEYTNIWGYKLKNILLQNGFRDVEITKDYTSLNTRLRQISQSVDCIIADLDDRGQDVISLIKKMKTIKNTENIPVISISSDSNISNLKKAIAVGCIDFILKPFETETLIRKVHKVCHQEKGEQATSVQFETGELFTESAITLKWNKGFEIGIELIDREHEKIIENFDKLYMLMRNGQGHEFYEELLAFLYEYVNTHFEHEEQLQLRISYNGYQKHKEIHDSFKLKVEEMIENHKEQSVTNRELISISLFIKDWLLHHILIEDKKIKDSVPTDYKEDGL